MYSILNDRKINALIDFYNQLSQLDKEYFKPHEFDFNSISKIIINSVIDKYILMIQNNKIIGYGLLRGWDMGYACPSLGIAVHPSVRGQGLSTKLISYLHKISLKQGSYEVRLRVHIKNEKAIRLYTKVGYEFKNNLSNTKEKYITGFINLKK